MHTFVLLNPVMQKLSQLKNIPCVESGNIKATVSDLESLYNQTIHALVFAGVNHASTYKKICQTLVG